MMAGAVAGSATVMLTNPIWVVNTRMTARKSETQTSSTLPTSEEKPSKGKAPSTLGTLRSLLKDEGFGALFAGVLPALVLVINPILQYTIFEQLKNFLEARRRRLGGAQAGITTPRDAFVLGALGKLLATSITYPYITVKSRAHVKKGKAGSDASEGLTGALRRIVKEEGWGGLYGGMLTPPACERRFLTYIRRHWPESHPERPYRGPLVCVQGRPV
jgi:solute carrier family 25 (peroxisomal adenine nucleotide transporter), member 17